MLDKAALEQNGVRIFNENKENKLLSFLKQNYPKAIKDNRVNLKEIAEILGLSSDKITSGYELTWSGKSLANRLYSTPTNKELKLNRKTSLKNQIIIGDNLDALKLLQSAYFEKIKLIYIDPPYNTGNENFIYPDNFRDDYKEILKELGLVYTDKNGNEIESDDVKCFKNIYGSRSHSGWLSFMLPRLKLSRDLLRDDGVIFISIDDNEQANLKLLCDEVFGEENFVADFIWQKKYSPTNDAKFVSVNHDYILCYAKDINKAKINLLPRTDEMNARYKNPDNDPRGVWKPSDLSVKTYSAECDYPITTPSGRVVEPPSGRSWRASENKFKEMVADGRVWFGDDGDAVPQIKRFLSEVQQGAKPISIFMHSEVGHNQEATKELANIFNGASTFDTPKPVRLIKRILQLTTSSSSNDLILDFFAGSGTTAAAVNELNSEDGGNREFILVQLDEKIDESKSKAAYEFVKNELGASEPKISDITVERVKRAGAKFSVYELADKPELTSNQSGSLSLKTKSELSPEDRARNMALKTGKMLNEPLIQIIKNELYLCDECYYVVGFSDEVIWQIKRDKKIYIDGYFDFRLSDILNLNIDDMAQILLD